MKILKKISKNKKIQREEETPAQVGREQKFWGKKRKGNTNYY